MYQCWGPDHEDLTAKVQAAIDAKRGWHVLDAGLADGPASQEAITVNCSAGHVNVFYVTTEPS